MCFDHDGAALRAILDVTREGNELRGNGKHTMQQCKLVSRCALISTCVHATAPHAAVSAFDVCAFGLEETAGWGR